MRTIFDADPGVDDALALLWLLGRHDSDVRAVTTVSGNVDVDLGTANALKLLGLTSRQDIPVYRGADKPLQGEAIRAHHIHGASGLGQAELPATESVKAQGCAIGVLGQMLRSSPGQHRVIAVGPLTNLARAERHDPGVLKDAAEIIVMGGSINVPGNVTPTGEFNFVSDPLAARQVLRSGAELRLVSLDVTRQLLITETDLTAALAQAPTAIRDFCLAATSTAMAVGRERYGYRGLYLHDPLTAMLAFHPELADWETLHVDVETRGELTTGQLVADQRRQAQRTGALVKVATRIQVEDLREVFFAVIRALKEGDRR